MVNVYQRVYSRFGHALKFDLRPQSQGQIAKWPISCLLLTLELRFQRLTYTKGYIAVLAVASNLTFDLHLKVKLRNGLYLALLYPRTKVGATMDQWIIPIDSTPSPRW